MSFPAPLARGLVVVFFSSLIAIAAACSSETASSSGSSGASSSGQTSSGTGATSAPVSSADCQTACGSKATECKAPSATADQLCGAFCGRTVTQADVDCLKAKSCEALAGTDDPTALCASGSSGGTSSGSSGSSGTSGSSGSACKPMKGACTTVGASNCCVDGDHSKVMCGGNNDGKGNAQCCVAKGEKCVDVSECCYYDGASATAKALYKCAAGRCEF